MKTGKLLKFPGRGAQVHAYVYREGAVFRASIYVLAPGQHGGSLPAREVTGGDSARVEADVRAWVDLHFPRQH